MIPARWCNQLPYHERRYDPIWALCEEYDMPIVTHSGSAPREEYGDLLGIYVTEVAWWLTRPLVFMIWGGVFERFPGLRVAVTEPDFFATVDHPARRLIDRSLRELLRPGGGGTEPPVGVRASAP